MTHHPDHTASAGTKAEERTPEEIAREYMPDEWCWQFEPVTRGQLQRIRGQFMGALTAANQHIAELEGELREARAINSILLTEVQIVASVPTDKATEAERATVNWLKTRARHALDRSDPNLNGYLSQPPKTTKPPQDLR